MAEARTARLSRPLPSSVTASVAIARPAAPDFPGHCALLLYNACHRGAGPVYAIPRALPTRLDDILAVAAPLNSQKRKDISMSITADRKQELIKEYATKAGDTGSPEVQVAILSERITTLTDHFKSHVKDNHSRRGLLKMVSQRRSLLDYLKSVDEGRYQQLIQRLGIRR